MATTSNPNRQLAAHARTLADQHAPGTLPRKAALCVAICLQEANTITGARRLLTHIRPDPVKTAATDLFDHLTKDQP